MWWRRFIDLLKFETRPSCLPNFGTAKGYPLSFLQKITKTKKPRTSSTSAKPTIECKSSFTICQSPSRTTSPLPTTTRHTCCFESTTPSTTDKPAKQDGLVYRIACEFGKVYIGETGRPIQDRIRETSDLPVGRPPPFQSTLTTPDTTRFGTN